MPADPRLQAALRLLVQDPTSGPPVSTDDPGVYPEDWLGFGHVDYFYRRNAVLVRTGDVERVRTALRGEPDSVLPEGVDVFAYPVIDGVTGLRWHSTSAFGIAEFQKLYADELAAIERAREDRGKSAAAFSSKRNDEDQDHKPDDKHGDDKREDDKHGDDKPDDKHGDDEPGEHGGGEGEGGGQGGSGYQHWHTEDEWPLTTPWVLTKLDGKLGVGVARPDTLLPLQDNGHPCPATEPAEVPAATRHPTPVVTSGRCGDVTGWDGTGVRVGIVDNGLVDSARRWDWMRDVEGEPDITVQSGTIAPYAGHGTFVAGCVRSMAPAAEVCVKNVPYPSSYRTAGAAYESTVVQRMGELIDEGSDIIVCEFAGDTRFRLPLPTFEAFYLHRLRYLNVAVVAPAGNDSTREPRYPAAFSWATGVGALSANGRSRASFSNYGGWVDLYAPGENQINAFADGDYVCIEDPQDTRHFDGLAEWSGTSFSAPLVAGMIAARMSGTGENPVQATEALLRTALKQAVRGIGPVLRPGDQCEPRPRRRSWLCRLLMRLAGCDCGRG